MKAPKSVLTFFIIQILFCSITTAQKQFKALLVTTTRGWHHESIHSGVLAIQELGRKNYF